MAFWKDADFYRPQNYLLMVVLGLTILGLFIPYTNGMTLWHDDNHLISLILMCGNFIFATLGLIYHNRREWVSKILIAGIVFPTITLASFSITGNFDYATIFFPSLFLLPQIGITFLLIIVRILIQKDIKILKRADRLWN